MYISENSMDLYLLENYPHKFSSLYGNDSLNEGTIGDLRRITSNVINNIGTKLKNSGIDIKKVIGEINREISISKSRIINHLGKGDSFEASIEFSSMINTVSFRLREFYKSKGIIEKGIILLLFLFIIMMSILLIIYSLINYTMVFIILIVVVPIILALIKIALSILKFKHKSDKGLMEKELNKSIINSANKLGIENNIMVNLLAKTTKELTNKAQRDFSNALENKISGSKTPFTTKAILMIIKTVKDQFGSGLF